MFTLNQHIRLDQSGIAWIADTAYKVTHVVQESVAYGWSPEELVFQHHGDLTLGQVHAALSFYHDNRDELDAVMQREQDEYSRLRDAGLDSPLRQKLRMLRALAMSFAFALAREIAFHLYFPPLPQGCGKRPVGRSPRWPGSPGR